MVDTRDSQESPTHGSGRSWRRRATDWVLLTGDRTAVAAVFTSFFFVFFTLVRTLPIVPLLEIQALFYVYSALITGNFTLITVVVSINQLLLSRELQTPGELRTQIENVIEYRRDVEAAAGDVAPVQPLGFLRFLIEAAREQAQRLGGLVRTGGGGRPEEEAIVDEVSEITEEMDRIGALLREQDTGTINVLGVLLRSNYAREIHRLREIEHRYEERIADSTRDSITELIDRLQEIDIARQYFKTIYFQQELSSLSRVLLYAGLPAMAVSIGTLLALTVPVSAPGLIPYRNLLLPISLTIGVVPLSILCSYIVRTATITKLTAATLPFTTPEQER